MSEYNPNATLLRGIEWLPALAPSITLDAPTKIAAMSLKQVNAQTIGAVRAYVGALPQRGGVYAMEIYNNETAVPANFTNAIFRPGSDVSGVANSAGFWTDQASGVTNIYNSILGASFNPALYIYNNGGGADTYYRGRMTIGAALNGKRILSVQLTVVVQRIVTDNNTVVLAGVHIGSTDYYAINTEPAFGVVSTLQGSFAYNPSTKQPWTVADLAKFDTTGTGNWFVAGNSTPDGGVAVFQAYMTVVYADENRLAFGILDDSASALTANAWNASVVLTPTGGAWTKGSTGYHLYTLRRLTSVGSLVVPELDSGVQVNPARTWLPTLDPTYGYATAMGSALSPVFGILQRTSAPADSVDSQTYVLPVEAHVYNGQAARQEMSAFTVASYTTVKALVKPNTATGNMIVRIKRVSDNVQFGTDVTLTPAAAAALTDQGNGWKLLNLTLGTGASLVGATQYYVEFSDATAGDDGTGTKYWSVLTLDDITQGDTSGFGGTTDAATINGSRLTRYDIPTTLAGVPLPVTNFAATTGSLAIAVPAGAAQAGCEVDHVSYIALSWTATALGANFLRYDIDRSDDGGTTWNRVAQLVTEALAAWNDYEALRSVQECYRIRVVRIDNTPSAWSANQCATVNAQYCELIFVSNWNSALTVAYGRPPLMDYDVLDYTTASGVTAATPVVFAAVFGRDRVVGFQPTERLGISFAVTVRVNMVATPIATGVAAFNALRTLAAAQGNTIPYVCVLDHQGNRWNAMLQIPKGANQEPFSQYKADLVVTEVRTTPLFVTVS